MCGEVVQHGDGLLKLADLCMETIRQVFGFSLHTLFPVLQGLEGLLVGSLHKAEHGGEHSPDV